MAISRRQPADGKGDDIHGGQGFAAHRVDVAEAVGRRDLAEQIGVVHDRREEIQGLDQGGLIIQAVDAGVVGRVDSHQNIRVRDPGKFAEYVG